ncbi:MAG: tryptophan--tRNA ligase [Opitutales bacterium]|nr:tryptophan--tRNA ligase [Opitutales bacterium]MCH8539663.1 tryptophan--tRNA ligase [Opitutales bacterium]
MSETKAKPVILTGAKPSGELTLGNYLGAIRNWATMMDDFECFFPIVDLHAITVPYKPADLRQRTYQCLAQYLACGLDPARSHIFLQSQITGHTELNWLLACLTPVGDLHRMTQFKEKSAKPGASVNSGLLFYPVLMAADILLYNADRVPVGEDQKQHLEMARNLAQRFNHTYSDTFKVPEPFIPKAGARVMSLQNPTRKMSKSDDNENDYLLLLDPPNRLRKKIMSAVTDSGSEVRADPEKPGITNLLNIFSAVSDRSIADLEKEFGSQGYGTFKKAVAEAVVARLEPIQEKYHELISNKDYLHQVLREGGEVAQKRAYRMLSKVYRKAGFVART